ncbi:hypothetical protein IFM89_017300, partial [Coptis chinensis]
GENEVKDAAFIHGAPSQDDNKGPPRVDSEAIILHEKVTKKIIKEGRGEKPSKAWHKFEDTWQEQRPIEIVLGKEKNQMTGLAIAVASMKSGECALLHVGWELGYGKEGSFSFPNVPPMADLIYEVELIGFDETKEGKARGDMTVEERIGAANMKFDVFLHYWAPGTQSFVATFVNNLRFDFSMTKF